MAKLKLVATGSRASETTAPGNYILHCISGFIQSRGNKTQVVLTFRVVEQAWNDGIVLRQWYSLPARDGAVSPHTRYARACELALGRTIEANDELDPQTVFSGKFFEAAVGFRSNNLGGELDEANREERKDNRDFLRVHKIIRLVPEDEAAAIVHIRSNGVIWPPET